MFGFYLQAVGRFCKTLAMPIVCSAKQLWYEVFVDDFNGYLIKFQPLNEFTCPKLNIRRIGF